MQKVFYDAVRNLEIVDVSGQKSLATIKQQFGDGTFDELEYNPLTHVVEYKNGKPSKTSISDIKQGDDSKKQQAVDALKTKLSLSDDDIKNLKLAVK